mgnify:CR=1 FL=1
MNQKERNDEILDMLEEAVGITLADFERVGGYFSYELPAKQAEKAQFADDCFAEFNYKLGKLMAAHPDKSMQDIRRLFFKSVNNWRKDEKKRHFRQFTDGRGRDSKVEIEPERYKLLRRNNTQAQMAEAMGVKQPTIAGLERAGQDLRLSSLKRYVEAIGGRVRLDVELPDGSHHGFPV